MNKNVIFIDNRPYRNYGSIKIAITEWCSLGDCNQAECHHCFPVKNCIKHNFCVKHGCCPLIPIPVQITNTKQKP